MGEKDFDSLPEEIKTQIVSVLQGEGKDRDTESLERYARVWQDKYDLFSGQIHAVGMEIVDRLEESDSRAAILLTYSGSLISLGPNIEGKRTLEYASIRYRTDVPDFVKSTEARIEGTIEQGASASFSRSPLKQSSGIFRIAVCAEGTSVRDQESRVREATVYLTNGFVKINRTLGAIPESEVEDFTARSIVSYIAKKHEITQVSAKAILEDYLSAIESGVLLGERVALGKLGSLCLKRRAASKARVMKNLATGEDILVPAKGERLVPKFTPSQALKEKALAVDVSKIGGDTSDGDADDE